MLLRCEKCAAVFSLQDGAAAHGAAFKVECGRCLNVFDAKPLPPRSPPPPLPLVPPKPAAPDPGALERKAQADELAKALRPHRPEDDQRELERALLAVSEKRRRKARWMLAAVALGLVAALGYGLRQRFAGMPRGARERIEKARALLLRDDSAALQEATALFTEAARIAPGAAMPEGERGFAMLLQAAAQGDLAARLLATQDKAQQQEGDELQRASVRLLQHGVAAAKAALDDDPEDLAALRAMALATAVGGAPDQGALQKLEALGAQDPWVLYVKAVSQRKSPQDALNTLALVRQAQPHLLRAQVELAGLSMDKQEPGPARDLLNTVVKENPNHERARRMLSLLPAAP